MDDKKIALNFWVNTQEFKKKFNGKEYINGLHLYSTRNKALSLETNIKTDKNERDSSLVFVKLESSLHFMENKMITLEELQDFNLVSRFKKTHTIQRFFSEISQERSFDGTIPLYYLIHSLFPQQDFKGKEDNISKWFISKGIDVMLNPMDKTNLVLFNPRVVIATNLFDEKTAEFIGDFESVEIQLQKQINFCSTSVKKKFKKNVL